MNIESGTLAFQFTHRLGWPYFCGWICSKMNVGSGTLALEFTHRLDWPYVLLLYMLQIDSRCLTHISIETVDVQ